MTAAWKLDVRRRLDENKRQGVKPGTQTELADELDVDKSAITKMLKKTTVSSKLVEPICRILNLQMPLVAPPPQPTRRARLLAALDSKSSEAQLESALVMVGGDPDDIK
jgi:hypothetical protein